MPQTRGCKQTKCGATRCAPLRGNAKIPRSADLAVYAYAQALLRFFDGNTAVRRCRTTVVLALEDRCRTGRDQFVAFQNKFGINGIAGWLVNAIAREVTGDF